MTVVQRPHSDTLWKTSANLKRLRWVHRTWSEICLGEWRLLASSSALALPLSHPVLNAYAYTHLHCMHVMLDTHAHIHEKLQWGKKLCGFDVLNGSTLAEGKWIEHWAFLNCMTKNEKKENQEWNCLECFISILTSLSLYPQPLICIGVFSRLKLAALLQRTVIPVLLHASVHASVHAFVA